jgi:hypothetical protein
VIGAAIVLAAAAGAGAAGAEAWTIGGYVRDSPLLWTEPVALGGPGGATGRQFTNLLHTRENLRVYPAPFATLGLEVKTRLLAGDGARDLTSLTNLTGAGRTYFDWERRFVDEPRCQLVSTLDRVWLDLESGPVQVSLGRQRVAWGTGLVWNPIDILNPSSPLDFDNQEKPGTDAGRMQVYLGPSSKVDVAVAPARRADDAVALAQVVANRAGYDWIAIAGRRGPYAVLGAAWSGSMGGGGFRGEALGSIPRRGLRLEGSADEERNNLVASVDGDYTFPSSLYLHGAALFNRLGATGEAGGARLLDAYRRGWLTPARASLFAEAARDLGPLVRADITGILDPGDRSWYAGPTLTWSVVANLDLSASGLVFGGASGTEFGDDGEILMARFQWSF